MSCGVAGEAGASFETWTVYYVEWCQIIISYVPSEGYQIIIDGNQGSIFRTLFFGALSMQMLK